MPHPAPAIQRHLQHCLLASALLGQSPWALAETPPIKPGLWEVISEAPMVNGQAMPDMSAKMADQMSKMPPQMRQQIEAQMKARGVQMAQPASGGGMAMRMCLSKEMLAQNRWQKTEGRCQNTALNKSGATWTWQFTCTEPPGSGEDSTTFLSNEAYVNELHMNTERKGKATSTVLKHRGKWLGADCGDIQPMSPPNKP